MKRGDLNFADLYPDATPFTEPTHKVFVHIENGRCVVCDAITRFLDFSTGHPVAVCSLGCFAEFPRVAKERRRRQAAARRAARD